MTTPAKRMRCEGPDGPFCDEMTKNLASSQSDDGRTLGLVGIPQHRPDRGFYDRVGLRGRAHAHPYFVPFCPFCGKAIDTYSLQVEARAAEELRATKQGLRDERDGYQETARLAFKNAAREIETLRALLHGRDEAPTDREFAAHPHRWRATSHGDLIADRMTARMAAAVRDHDRASGTRRRWWCLGPDDEVIAFPVVALPTISETP